MKLSLAEAAHAQEVTAFYAKIHDESFAHHEMFDAATVAQLLRDGELAVVVASDRGRILGCGLGFPHLWNHSLEIGALSVDDVRERGQVGKALFEALRRLGMRKYGLVVFRARTEAALRRSRNVGAVCWGYWPRPGARSLADAELLMGMFNDQAEIPRCEPPRNPITQLPFARRVRGAYTRAERGVPYPKTYPVGEPRGTGTPVISGRVWPTYHSRGNFITIESSAGRYPVEIIREFVAKVRKKGVADVRLALPVNHHHACEELLDFGFRPVSYMPGWFLKGAHRYDCVELVAGLPRRSHGEPMSFVERAIDKIDTHMTP